MNAIPEKLVPIVGDSSICHWDDLTPDWQERVARPYEVDLYPQYIVYPNSVTELTEVMKCAYHNYWNVLPCGNGTKLGWGAVGKPIDLVVSTQRLNQVIEHAVGDLTVTAQAGIKFTDLQEILLKTGQFLPIEPCHNGEATLGGIVATADSGSLRHRYGGIRDMLLGISFVRSDGTIAKAGGRVVKNVAGYDLMKLFTGSYGTLGILTEVTFRLYPVQEASGTVLLMGKADAIATATKILLASALTPTATDLLSTGLVTKLNLGEGMGLMVRFQSLSESVQQQSSRLLEVGKELGLTSNLYSDGEDTILWESLPKQIWKSHIPPEISCKIGVLPSTAVPTLTYFDKLTFGRGLAYIHAGSGLGKFRLETEIATPEMLQYFRRHCQEQGGFLTVLDAPIPLKNYVSVWGYSGTGANNMRELKMRFDSRNILSPERFVWDDLPDKRRPKNEE
ncbi:MAG TPA: FAD-binding oxidoreductase [Cyanobacteria bacterium UBA11149]|nr:FAD-binding oxidoreductase [Cyanobacteria bacterium UBA11367]HBE58686.1 FAD-binding oxidoreductase [Cyanobacteria bacterium UBA11366]HBK64723.1 FAD-binding oxidoreductase [Cyanobacteria bacterium UBA11166]HBR74545.1 FAD-binding oxidoreductase [Cyanobacteria bacterium UBA11159]HBS68562.1 FAD-binding oxidoreductase [Cyanobacteria bacterium UBA11153]HBW87552.1 FAD-binding oxidoreductase [Cyanobacteria bacterium UBA11149]HCA94604.1 FAD-binding oxidoreductase [Cyanobacteria bacterium UBA9226]